MAPIKQPRVRGHYGSNYILTMRTIHTKSTLVATIGFKPMMRFLETYIHDIYNSEYKHLLKRNLDRADAVIMAQKRFWEEWEKSGRDDNAASEYGLRDGKLVRLDMKAERKSTTGVAPISPDLDSEATALPQKKRKRTVTVEKAERETKRQREATRKVLPATEVLPSISKGKNPLIGAHPPHSSPYFLPSPTISAPQSPFSKANNISAAPQQQPLRRPVYINRERRCIAHARSYLEVLVRNARADHSWTKYGEDGYSSEDTDTETYSAEDSTILLGLRSNPLNTSDAKEIIDEVMGHEAILKAGYRGVELKKVAQDYEAGKKRLMNLLVHVIPWEIGMKPEDESRRLVFQVLRF